ncbi:hypothetical protein AB1L30_22790 [Bremerella sp. JC817]|uniref:hypothetical protein n=1 Tax=Bremerella sp. JC817 TaxID=3231756 RepID=UPI003457D83A
MDIVAVSCQHCGASLKVPMGTVHLTCGQCGTPLLVQYQGQSIFTQRQDASDDSAANVQQQLHDLRTEAEIARLDTAWQAKRESLKINYGHWGRGAPRHEFAVLVAVVSLGIAGLFGAAGENAAMVIFGLLGLLSAVMTSVQASRYQKAEAKYLKERQALSPNEMSAKHINDPRSGYHF